MNLHFINAKIFRDSQFVDGELWVADGKITDTPQKDASTIDVQGHFLVPGFIDLQINGAFGHDFAKDPQSVEAVSKLLGSFGVTSFLATVISSTPEKYHITLPFLQKWVGKTSGADLLGIHLEGPCFNLAQTKAHDPNVIRKCNAFSSPEECYGSLRAVKLLTMAPELPGASQWISWLASRGIVVSAGHTMATAEQMEAAMREGMTMATHLFNGMGPMHHRDPGVVGAVLARQGFYYTLIADGVHVDPRVVRMAWKAQPDGLILVSDAVAAAGMPTGEFSLGDVDIGMVKGVVRTKGTGVLAGCAHGLSSLLVRFCEMTGAPLSEAVKTVTERPAKALGIYPKKGSLYSGSDADIVIMDSACNIIATYARGAKKL